MKEKINQSVLDNNSSNDKVKLDQGAGSNSSVGLSASPQPVRVMSDRDSSIADLVKEQPTLEEIDRIDPNSTPGLNLLELPEECKRLHRKTYRFRWMANDKFLEARLRSSGWVLCTRHNSPYIKPSRFKAHGAVEQAGMLLAFMTEAMGAKRERLGSDKSRQLIKHYTEDLPKSGTKEAGGFYKPETGAEDEADDEQGET